MKKMTLNGQIELKSNLRLANMNKIDHINQLITLFVIPLRGAHCINNTCTTLKFISSKTSLTIISLT
jgi:hypothetical protein